MPVRVMTCYILVCDICGEDEEGPDYTPHWASKEEALNHEAQDFKEYQNLLICFPCQEDEPIANLAKLYYAKKKEKAEDNP